MNQYPNLIGPIPEPPDYPTPWTSSGAEVRSANGKTVAVVVPDTGSPEHRAELSALLADVINKHVESESDPASGNGFEDMPDALDEIDRAHDFESWQSQAGADYPEIRYFAETARSVANAYRAKAEEADLLRRQLDDLRSRVLPWNGGEK